MLEDVIEAQQMKKQAKNAKTLTLNYAQMFKHGKPVNYIAVQIGGIWLRNNLEVFLPPEKAKIVLEYYCESLRGYLAKLGNKNCVIDAYYMKGASPQYLIGQMKNKQSQASQEGSVEIENMAGQIEKMTEKYFGVLTKK